MASFVGPKTVVVNGVEYTADHINIAVGGRPIMPDVPGAEFCIDRQEAFFCVSFFVFNRFIFVVFIVFFVVCVVFFVVAVVLYLKVYIYSLCFLLFLSWFLF